MVSIMMLHKLQRVECMRAGCTGAETNATYVSMMRKVSACLAALSMGLRARPLSRKTKRRDCHLLPARATCRASCRVRWVARYGIGAPVDISTPAPSSCAWACQEAALPAASRVSLRSDDPALCKPPGSSGAVARALELLRSIA